jgi:sulfide dehydrogenase cytochrome subunit
MRNHIQFTTVIVMTALGSGTPALGQGAAPLAAQACLGCHGPNGAGQDAVVGITGQTAGDLEATMKAFRANERPGTIMGRIARGYTDAEIAQVAAYFAAQPR